MSHDQTMRVERSDTVKLGNSAKSGITELLSVSCGEVTSCNLFFYIAKIKAIQ